jgi:hypothetical protein
VEGRRNRIFTRCERPLASPALEAELPERQLGHLRREAEDLFWNELSWEQLTDEEAIGGGHLTELVFPAFLAFVDGLIGSPAEAAARPRPDAIEAILTFLGERHGAFSADLDAGADSQRIVWARAMTAHLTDLVLYRLYGLDNVEREQLDLA